MRLVEPFAVIDIFTSGVGRVEILRGGNMRLTYFTDATAENGRVERVVAAKIIIPIDAVIDCREQVSRALELNKAIRAAEFVVGSH
jgi:hypothetical protein